MSLTRTGLVGRPNSSGSGLGATQTARGEARWHPAPNQSTGPLLVLAAVLDVHVALLLDPDFLLADGAADVLGVVDLPLADRHLLRHHRLLADVHLLLLDRDADLLGLQVCAGRGPLAD